ncbi:MAG: phosphate ABC transporter permease PstA [Candidatus Hydrogenedentes bacterium]|nr:phosphate ABC transporter permease PstA [Candidatus Hydrogenedentota bacterium]
MGNAAGTPETQRGVAGVTGTRKILDRYFTAIGAVSILLMAVALVALLAPIAFRGVQAFVFRGTVEHRLLQLEKLERGNRMRIEDEVGAAAEARQPVYAMLDAFAAELGDMGFVERRKYQEALEELEDALSRLLGPRPGGVRPALVRDQYGQTRWDRARAALHEVLYVQEYDYSDPTRMGQAVDVPRQADFAGTSLEPLFPYIEENLESMLRPRWTFYWGFVTDTAIDAHIFGGIWAEVLGTIYLTLGAMLFAVPMGVIAAIYLVEYTKENRLVALLRVCISTLAGVPSIVFGLFGLAFFVNTLHVSESKSVLAGSLTLALLVLPTIIRASEEAIRAVPDTYREASLGLGASRWRTVSTVILPAALPGILTGIVISMGRAAGETAPIIFTAAVSVGKPLGLWDTLSEATPALPWNIYNLCTEHEAAEAIRHVQFGMVFTLVGLVLLLNVSAIVLRARVSKRLKG